MKNTPSPGPPRRITRTDNGGPPLEARHVPEWGLGPVGNYFRWKQVHRAAWRSLPRDTTLARLERAEAIGLTYAEYTLEILERGRRLRPEDAELIAAIKRKRRRKQARRP